MSRASMLHIVIGPLLRITQNLVGVMNRTEGRSIARLLVIRMKALGLHAINAMDGLLVGVRADLQRLVIIDEH